MSKEVVVVASADTLLQKEQVVEEVVLRWCWGVAGSPQPGRGAGSRQDGGGGGGVVWGSLCRM